MAQIFHPSTNVIAKLSIVALALAVPSMGAAAYFTNMSYATQVQIPREQPVQFSHKHHVGEEGFDCRYCHNTVDKSAAAGMPSTHTCMTCHSQIWNDSPLLEPLRESYRTGQPIKWTRVHDLPDFAHFNHSIHIKKGVGCSECHGPVDEMPLMYKAESLTMQWCLDCHRKPENRLRPADQVYNMDWKRPANQKELGLELKEKYHVLNDFQLTNCSICHH
jgi:hypothetical protein